jgi:multimeric flavodoxin WrbA
MNSDQIKARKGMPSHRLDQDEYLKRFKASFIDPAFAPVAAELDRVALAAWDGYSNHRKSPITRRGGPEFEDPDYELSVDWLEARGAIAAAQALHDDPQGPARFLLINGATRSEHTCPGEMSKSWRLLQFARDILEADSSSRVEVLDLSRVASEYGRHIHPCKTCFSTAAPLCHWPCSCYPNYFLGQTHDWMNQIYPMWIAAHGIFIVTPVNWFHVSSPLKLMMDRMVCADGGNPDPTSTGGKDAERAKRLEMQGWRYRRPLSGRRFSCVVHGDAEGAREARNSLVGWLTSLELKSAGEQGELDRYLGYWKPYANSHAELDADLALEEEVRNAARTLRGAILTTHATVLRGQETEPKFPAPRDK